MSGIVVVLNKIASASKEAYFSWDITLPESVTFKKGMLCLTDIDQDGDADSAIFKYQLHSTESPAGAHIFEDLHVGDYYARLTIIGSDNSMAVSELLTVTVYDLGAAKINSVSPRDNGFFITLDPYNNSLLQPAKGQESAQIIEKVSFILFGRKTDANGFVTGPETTKNLNIVKDYNPANTYLLNYADGIQNSWQYEIACFYTDNKTISGDISNTLVETPTNKPNQIKDVEAIYDYANKQLIIKYTNPNDISEWTPTNVRATLTYGSAVPYVFSASSNSGTDFQGEELVFNEVSSPRLTADTVFTLTLAMESSKFGYSDLESEPITCIVPAKFSSEKSTISNVNYIVGDNEFSVTYNKATLSKYDVTVHMVITDTETNETVYETDDYVSGSIVEDVVNGGYYKVNLQVFYTAKIDSSIVFGPSDEEIEHFDYTFIPHGQADAPSDLQVSYGDGTATLSWSGEIDLHGYILDRYELSSDGGSTWFPNNTNTSYEARCDNGGYISGNEYNFKVRAVTISPDTGFYSGQERIYGKQSQKYVYPLKNPESPNIVSQTPIDSACVIEFQDVNNFGGARQYYKYTINNSSYDTIISNTTITRHTFEGLTNNEQSIISISVVTKSGPDNVRESEPVVVYTTPFKMPDVPTLSAIPYTSCVKLSWSPNNPDTILGENVEYDVEYKLVSASMWNTENSNVTSILSIHNLTSNSEYQFRIRSKVYNLENDTTLYSDYSSIINSRPFIYRNAPTMNLIAGNGTITVEITPPVSPNDNYYGPNKYYATVDTDPDVQGSGIILELSSNTSSLIFNVGNSGLVNLSKYKVDAWYDMVIDEPYETTTEPYESNSVSNSVTPFDENIVPLLFSDPDDGTIKLTWDDSNMVGLTITGYQVSSKSYTSSSWGVYEPLSLTDSHQEPSTTSDVNDYYIIRNHANGTKMSYKIRAVISNAGNTYYSKDSREAVATPYTYASVPRLNSYVSSSNQIVLNWNVPLDLGGLPLQRYEVSTGSGVWIPTNSTTYSFNTDLVNGQKYTFKVRAVTNNRDNVGQVSNLDTVDDIESTNVLVQEAIPYDNPSIILDSVVSGDLELTLNWEDPYLGGHKFDHYKIYYGVSSIDNITSTNLSYTITSLVNGNDYACAVEIYVKDENDNAGSRSVFSTQSMFKTNIPYVPAVAPKNVSSVPSDESVRVSWDDLIGEELGGLPLKRYEVKKEGDSIWITANGELYHDFDGLFNGTQYTFYVRAVTKNNYHTSDPEIGTEEVVGAEESKNDIPYLPLDAPLLVSCVPGDQTVGLTWSEPNLVGLTLDHYEVLGGSLSGSVNVGTATYYNFSGLANNTMYAFYVKAVATHTFAGPVSGPNLETSKIPYARPSRVENLSCTAINGVLTVYFTDPDESSVNNGLAQDYKIKVLYPGDVEAEEDYNDIENAGTVSIPRDSTQTIGVYVYSRIRDPNDSNNDTNSVYSFSNHIDVVNSNLESDIQNLTATPGDQQVTLNWENINANSGSTYAIVRIKEDGSFQRLDNVYEPKAIITTLPDGSRLVNGTNYRFNVYASQDDMLQITSTPIGPPKDLSASGYIVNVNFNGDSKVSITIIGITESTAEITGPTSYTTTNDKLTTINQLTTTVDLSLYLKYVVIASNSVGAATYVSPDLD